MQNFNSINQLINYGNLSWFCWIQGEKMMKTIELICCIAVKRIWQDCCTSVFMFCKVV